MKKALFNTAVLTILIALTQSCAPKRKMPRPQRHPTPPKKFVMQQAPVAPVGVAVLYNA